MTCNWVKRTSGGLSERFRALKDGEGKAIDFF